MDQSRMSKQVIELQKTAFDSFVSSMLFCWDSTQSLSRALLNQNPWVPEEGKRALVEWAQSGRRVLEDFKRAIDDGYSRMDRCFVSEWQQSRERREHQGWQQRQESQEPFGRVKQYEHTEQYEHGGAV